MREKLVIKIRTKFYQRGLGMDGFFYTKSLMQLELLQKQVLNILGYNMTRGLIEVGDDGGFQSGSLGWR